MPLSQYCKILPHPDDPGLAMLFSTRTVSVLSLPAEVLSDIERGTLSGDEKEILITHGILVRSHDVEKQEMKDYVDELNRKNAAFGATVVMNLDCNLACKYCFEGTRKGKHYLSDETGNDVLGFINRNSIGKKQINVVFYGGEPLLSKDMILRLSERLKSHADARGIEFGFSLITNGTLLTRRVAEQLRPIGLLRAYVTLDGPSQVHNSSRPFKSGAGSFDTILRNLQEVAGLIDVEVSGNFTRTNYRAFPELLETMIQCGLGPDRVSSVSFYPVFNEVRLFSPDFRGGCSSVNEPWLAEAGPFLRQQIRSFGFNTEDVQPTVCMVERLDHLVINCDGSLYKCPGLIGRDEYCVGFVTTGLRDYSLTHNLGYWKNKECLECVYLPLCFGGCRYLKLIRDGNMQGVDCKREYFDRTLHTLVLQDVEQGKTARNNGCLSG